MKNLSKILAFAFFLFMLNSCGVNRSLVVNLNQNTTQVHLSEKNFEIVREATGSSEVSYVLIFGGMNKKRLYQDAYVKLIRDANLEGSQALVNVNSEEQWSGVPPFYYTRTITLHAQVIEFTR